ncbi:MAG: GEVED domain-containing protein [Planctomycetota bacterium]|jgi:hypothetical protein
MKTTDISAILISALVMGLAVGVANGQYVLSGRVYEGDVTDESTPLNSVTMKLYGAIDSNELGTLLDSATTEGTGWYGLDVPIDPVYEFYNIVQDYLPDYEFVGATTVSGTVKSNSWIQYTYPLDGKTLTGNKFWQRPPNSPPVITSTAVTTATEDTLYTYDVEATDPDDDPLAYSLTTSPAGMTIDAVTGLIEWIPSGTQVGSHDVTVEVSDGRGGNDTQSFTIDVAEAVNNPPEANDDTVVTLQDTPVMIEVLANDGDPDDDPLTVDSVTQGENGSAEINEDNTVTYTPNPGFYGPDTFTYTISDGRGGTDTATVTVTVEEGEPTNQPPEVFAGDDQVFVADEFPIELKWGSEASDDGLPDPPAQLSLTWSLLEGPAAVQFYDPNAVPPAITFHAYGAYMFQLKAFDGEFEVFDEVIVEIRESEGGNQPPRVHAVDLTVDCDPTLLPFPVPLAGTVEDDGLPEGEELVIEWTLVSGPGEVEFEEPANPQTTASFSAYGSYVLRLRGFDGEFEVFDEVIVEIQESAAQGKYDFGDAPEDPGLGYHYPTLLSTGARHKISTGVHLGAKVDGEPDGQPQSSSALGDDNDTGPSNLPPPPNVDDEDGVTLGSLRAGRLASVTVTASIDGYLDAWVDFTCNGDWADPCEHVLTAVLLSPGSNSLSFLVPATATHGTPTYARFRFRKKNVPLSYDGPADDGEVEDYMVDMIEEPQYDFGDAPTSAQSGFAKSYPTTLAQNGARHVIVDGGPYIGFSGDVPDSDTDGQPDPNAGGDDDDGNNDEDGARGLGLFQGAPQDLALSVGGGGGYVGAWIDFNGDGDWDAGEEVFQGWLGDGVHDIEVKAPFGSPLYTFGRFRITSLPERLKPTGPALDGEVEDHKIGIAPADFGDAPVPYPTLHADNGAYHSTHFLVIRLGEEVDPELNGQPDANALGDDLKSPYPGRPFSGDDEDGVRFLTKQLIRGQLVTVETKKLIRGQQTTVEVEINNDYEAFLCAWIDFDGDKTWNDSTERIITKIYTSSGYWTDEFQFQIPSDAKIGTTFARFRIGSEPPTHPNLPPTGYGGWGEVEDYEVEIVEAGPPQVFAGDDIVVTKPTPLPYSIPLTGRVLDDGLPDPPGEVTMQWSVTDGPGEVQFEDATDPQTTATLYAYGIYRLELVAEDGGTGPPPKDQVEIQITDPLGELVAYYPFYEGQGTIAHDASGYGYHWDLIGDPCWVQIAPLTVPGHTVTPIPPAGYALEFDGDDHVSGSPTNRTVATGQITVSAWINFEGPPGTKEVTIPLIKKGDVYELTAELQDSNEPLWFGFIVLGEGAWCEHPPEFETQRWHHVVGTYDGQQVCLYIDGILWGSTDHATTLTHTSPTTIGGPVPPEYQSYFDSAPYRMDEVRMYSSALDAGQVAELFEVRQEEPRSADLTGDGVVDARDLAETTDLWLVRADEPWIPAGILLHRDIGDPAKAGSASYEDGVWTIEAAGEDVWGTADDFHYLYRSLVGDGMLTARVLGNDGQGVNEWAKVGVMIRETLEPDSKHAMMAATPGDGVSFQWRPETGGLSESIRDGNASEVTVPVSLKVERLGDTFTGYYSLIEPDLDDWVPVGSMVIPMRDEVYIGLAATSGDDQTLYTATIDEVSAVIGPKFLPADLHPDGKVDFKDFGVFADQWKKYVTVSLSNPAPVNTNAGTDSANDKEPRVATDGKGNWVVVWQSSGGFGSDFDILFSRSVNDGKGWSPVVALNSNASSDSAEDKWPRVAADGKGNWVVVWQSSGFSGTDCDILFSRSADNGNSWSTVAALNLNAASDGATDIFPAVTADGKGNWVVVWEGPGLTGYDSEIMYSHSGDHGKTWTYPAALNNYAGSDSAADMTPDIACDGSTWMTVWSSNYNTGGIGTDSDILFSLSTTKGMVWGPAKAANSNASTDSAGDSYPEIAKGTGWNWIVVWQSSSPSYGFDPDILLAQTQDGGLSWYAPELANDYGKSDTTNDTEPCIAADGTGGMVAVWTTHGDPKWTIGNDVDALFSYSKDDGRIWSKAQPLNLSATVDAAADWYPDVAGDGKGTWLGVWYSNNPLGGTGSDYDIFVTRLTLP